MTVGLPGPDGGLEPELSSLTGTSTRSPFPFAPSGGFGHGLRSCISCTSEGRVGVRTVPLTNWEEVYTLSSRNTTPESGEVAATAVATNTQVSIFDQTFESLATFASRLNNYPGPLLRGSLEVQLTAGLLGLATRLNTSVYHEICSTCGVSISTSSVLWL